jgi:hypothetical protein
MGTSGQTFALSFLGLKNIKLSGSISDLKVEKGNCLISTLQALTAVWQSQRY